MSTSDSTGLNAASSRGQSTPAGVRQASEAPLVLTVGEASALLRLDPRTVRALYKAGELEGNQHGHTIRLSRQSVLDWACGRRRVPRSKR